MLQGAMVILVSGWFNSTSPLYRFCGRSSTVEYKASTLGMSGQFRPSAFIDIPLLRRLDLVELTGGGMNEKYAAVYKPEHPYAHVNGYVYGHRLVMEKHLGRYLEPNEMVHHKDDNKRNNRLNNLELTTNRAHSGHHQGGLLTKRKCPVCGRDFCPPARRVRHCSPECGHISVRRVKRPSKRQLVGMLKKIPMVEIAKQFGVSDVAVAKWCKCYGVGCPARGSWTGRK